MAERLVHLSLNNSGPVCRLIISLKGMVLQTDTPNARSDLAGETGNGGYPDRAGQWHKVVEVRGIHMTAQVDGQQTIAGESSCVDVHKAAQGEGSNGRDFPDRISGRQSEC